MPKSVSRKLLLITINWMPPWICQTVHPALNFVVVFLWLLNRKAVQTTKHVDQKFIQLTVSRCSTCIDLGVISEAAANPFNTQLMLLFSAVWELGLLQNLMPTQGCPWQHFSGHTILQVTMGISTFWDSKITLLFHDDSMITPHDG